MGFLLRNNESSGKDEENGEGQRESKRESKKRRKRGEQRVGNFRALSNLVL